MDFMSARQPWIIKRWGERWPGHRCDVPERPAALTFVRQARASSLDVPNDVSVTGCDGGVGMGLDLLGLATLRIPVEAVARRALEVLGDLMRDRSAPVRHELFLGVFTAGSTLAPPWR